MKDIVGLIAIFAYLAGIALASGVWSVIVAIIFPPWAWYLLVEKALSVAGWIV
jgi:hypothetical protein